MYCHCRSDQTLQDIVYKLVPGLFKGKLHLNGDDFIFNKH